MGSAGSGKGSNSRSGEAGWPFLRRGSCLNSPLPSVIALKHLSGVSTVVCIHNPKFRGSNNITVRIQIVFSHHQQALLELDAAQLDIRRGQIFLKDFSYRQLLAGLETFQKKQFFILFQHFFIQLKPGSAEIMILKEKGTEA